MEYRIWNIANKAVDGVALLCNQEDAPVKGWPNAIGALKVPYRVASWDIVVLGRTSNRKEQY